MRWRRSRRRSVERRHGTVPSDEAPPASEAGPDAGVDDGATPESVVVFLHIPKCGGTSLHAWMASVLAPGVLSAERNRMPLELTADRREALAACRVFSGHFDVLDLRHLPGPQQRFTVLRDPVDRLVSLYDYWRAYDPAHVAAHDLVGPRLASTRTFEQFVGDPDPRIVHDLDNTIVRTFTGLVRSAEPLADGERALTDAIEFAESLDHVGHVGRLDDTVAWLRRRFGLPVAGDDRLERHNVRGEWTEPYLRNVERTTVSAAAREALEPLVELDRRLVERLSGAGAAHDATARPAEK